MQQRCTYFIDIVFFEFRFEISATVALISFYVIFHQFFVKYVQHYYEIRATRFEKSATPVFPRYFLPTQRFWGQGK